MTVHATFVSILEFYTLNSPFIGIACTCISKYRPVVPGSGHNTASELPGDLLTPFAALVVAGTEVDKIF